MNKDQFAYLNEEIKALESERDHLKAELNDEKQSFKYRGELILKLQKDCDYLKAELTEIKSNTVGAAYHENELIKLEKDCYCLKVELAEAKELSELRVRDITKYQTNAYCWRETAEKLADALWEFHGDCVTCEKGRLSCAGKEALSAFTALHDKSDGSGV